MRAPKALLATPYYAPKVGGLENYAHHIAQELIRRGWEVCAVATNHAGSTLVVEVVDGVRVYRLPATFKLSNTSIGFDWAQQIREIIKKERPDIINAHTPVPGMADTAARAAGDVPFVVTYHAATLYKQRDLLFNTIIFGYRLLETFMLRKTRKIIAVTPYHKDYMSKRTKRKFTFIENAIPDSDLLSVQPKKFARRLVFINNLARTHSWKGLDQVLEAIALSVSSGEELHLDVVGDGDYLDHYKQRVAELDIAQFVTFHGQQTGAQKDELLQRATALLCYPLTANDAFPTVILEAWARRTPVIVANIGALPFIVHDGQDGVLAEANNPAALSAAINRLLQDESLQRNVAIGGFERASDHTWAKQGAKTDALFRELIA